MFDGETPTEWFLASFPQSESSFDIETTSDLGVVYSVQRSDRTWSLFRQHDQGGPSVDLNIEGFAPVWFRQPLDL